MEPFKDRNGQPVQIGDTLAWDSRGGRVVAVVTRYGEFEGEPALFCDATGRFVDGPLFEHQIVDLEHNTARRG